jgi:hypothetical protein
LIAAALGAVIGLCPGDVIRDARFHRRGDAECLVRAAEVPCTHTPMYTRAVKRLGKLAYFPVSVSTSKTLASC